MRGTLIGETEAGAKMGSRESRRDGVVGDQMDQIEVVLGGQPQWLCGRGVVSCVGKVVVGAGVILAKRRSNSC